MDWGAWRGHKESDMTEQLTLSLNCFKNSDKEPDSGRELSPELPEKMARWVRRTWQGLEIRVHCIPSSPSGPANICLPNICFSISMWIAFLPYEVPNPHLQDPLLSLAEDGIWVRVSAIFPDGSVVKKICLLIQGRSPERGNGNPLQYSCLENPWTEELGGLQSMGSQRVRHDCACPLAIVQSFWWVTQSSWVSPCIQVIQIPFVFLLLVLPHINLILRPDRKAYKGEESSFPSHRGTRQCSSPWLHRPQCADISVQQRWSLTNDGSTQDGNIQ